MLIKEDERLKFTPCADKVVKPLFTLDELIFVYMLMLNDVHALIKTAHLGTHQPLPSD